MEVQRALYTKLTGDGVLMGMLNGVYDVVPSDALLPYVVIGDGSQTARAVDGINVTDCRLALHAWSASGGRKTTLAIMNRLHALLHLGTLTLSGFQLVTLRSEQASTALADQGAHLYGTLVILVTVAEV
jgi:hypothetical protein